MTRLAVVSVSFFAAYLLVTDHSVAMGSGAGRSCGSDPNPIFSMKSLISDCKGLVGVATSFGGGGIGFGSPEDNRAWAYYQRGLLYQFSHQSDLAIADYSNAIALRKNYADAYAARADAYAELGDHQHASSDYAQAASANSGDAYDLNRRCWARVVRGHPLDLALADCSEALKRNPNVIEALDSRCFVNYRMGNYAAAISDCTAVLAWRAREASSLFIRGLAKLRSGDVAGGKTDIDAAVDADYRIQEKYAAFDVRQ